VPAKDFDLNIIAKMSIKWRIKGEIFYRNFTNIKEQSKSTEMLKN
jgi:hypothetical protein